MNKQKINVPLVSLLIALLFLGIWWMVYSAPTQAPPGGNPAPAVSYWTLSGTSLYPTSTTYNVGIGTTTPMTQLHIPIKIPTSAVGSLSLSGSTGVFVQGRYAYISVDSATAGQERLYVVDVTNPAAPFIVGSVDVTGVSNGNPVDVFVQGRYAYVPQLFNIKVVDISNPSSPSVGASSASTGGVMSSIYVQGRYVYTVANNTLWIFDCANPASGTCMPVSSPATQSAPYGVYVQGRYVYVTNESSETLQIFSVSTSSAVSVGSVSLGAGSQPGAVWVQGRYAYVTRRGTLNNLAVVDVKNPAAPSVVASVPVGNYPHRIFVQENYAFVVNRDSNRIDVIDISKPTLPVNIGNFAGEASQARGIYVLGRYAYVVHSNTFYIFDLGGSYINQFEAGTIETGSLSVRNHASVVGNLDVVGGITASRGIQSTGDLGVYGNIKIQGTLDNNGIIFPDGSKQTTAATGFDPTTTVELMEDFVGGVISSGQVGMLGWSFTYSTSLGIGGVTNTAGRSGVISIGNAPSISPDVNILYLKGTGGDIIVGAQANLTGIISAKNGQVADANAAFRIGYTNNINSIGDPPAGIYFRATGLGNWFAVCRNANTETAVNTGVAQSTTFKQFKIAVNAAGTSVTFSIDGTVVATITTNIPTVPIFPVLQVEDSVGVSTRFTLDVDYFYTKITGLNR
jgi:hypothetical protein